MKNIPQLGKQQVIFLLILVFLINGITISFPEPASAETSSQINTYNGWSFNSYITATINFEENKSNLINTQSVNTQKENGVNITVKQESSGILQFIKNILNGVWEVLQLIGTILIFFLGMIVAIFSVFSLIADMFENPNENDVSGNTGGNNRGENTQTCVALPFSKCDNM